MAAEFAGSLCGFVRVSAAIRADYKTGCAVGGEYLKYGLKK
jgi:hypothetical protein